MKKNISKSQPAEKPQRRLPSLSLLGKSSSKCPDSPSNARLETFPNAYASRNYIISFDCPEFTSLCPVTGQPDFGSITIKYVADKDCIESKSLKLYLFSYRNHNTFHEEAVNSILDDIQMACRPRWIEVSGLFRPRGGIAITVVAQAGRKPLSI